MVSISEDLGQGVYRRATCADCILLLEVTWPNRSNDTKFCPNVFDECRNMCLSFLVNDS